jgi:HD-GYP domain-containing protein (c-di-GMP phosphodiesterase class II)
MSRPAFHTTSLRLHPLWEGRRLLLFIGLILTICTALLLIYRPKFVQQTELRLYDAMLTDGASPPKTAVPVMIGVDEQSLAAFGQWPWPRYRLALLVQRIRELGAEVIALDVLMPEPDRTSPEVIGAERVRDLGNSPAADASVHQDSNSRLLAKVLSGGNAILGYYFSFSGAGGEGGQELAVPPQGMAVESSPASLPAWPRPTGMLRSMPALTAAASAEGFTNAQHDLDGILRRAPLLMRYQGKFSPSLALSSLLQGSSNRNLKLVKDGSETLLVWGNRPIPLDRLGNLMINFRRGKNAFPFISAKAILEGAQPAGSLRGKIVLVGAWAQGLGDMHQVPAGWSLHGLEIHATIIDNILSGTFITRPEWARGAELSAIILLGVLSTWLLSQSGFVLSSLTVLAGSGGCYLGAKELLHSSGVFISPLMPMMTPIIVMAVLSLLKYGIEARKVRQRNRDLIEAQDALIVSVSALAEARDSEMGGHVQRTQYYVETLARHLATLPHYHDLDEASIDLIAKSAPLHDIGKVGIPDSILHKPGRLTAAEFSVMKTHTLIGAAAITRAMRGSARPESLEFLHFARQMIESHHEKWDGSGYPHGLSGADIPLAGRLMALADVYDALVFKRIYKRSFTHEEAQENILAESGLHFDPEVIAAFIAKNEDFRRISRMFADEPTDSAMGGEEAGEKSWEDGELCKLLVPSVD